MKNNIISYTISPRNHHPKNSTTYIIENLENIKSIFFQNNFSTFISDKCICPTNSAEITVLVQRLPDIFAEIR